MRRLAPAERRSFSRLGRCRVFPTSGFSATTLSNAWTPHRMRPRFARSSPPRPCFKCRFRRAPCTPPVETRHFKHGPQQPLGNSPRVCAYGANVAAICLFIGQTCRALSSFSRPAPCGLTQACPLWGRYASRSGFAAFTPRASVTPRRNAVSCRLLCAPFTGCGRNMPASAGKEVGRLRTCFVFRFLADESGFRLTRWIYCHSYFQAKN